MLLHIKKRFAMSNYTMRGADGGEYGPVDEATMTTWIQEGRANEETAIKKDEADWVEAAQLPEFHDALGIKPKLKVRQATAEPQPTPQPAQQEQTVQGMLSQNVGVSGNRENTIIALAGTLAAGSFWMKLFALFMFLNALGSALTIVGLLYAWLPLWMGVALWKGASRAQFAEATGNPEHLEQSLRSIKVYFTINGVLLLLMVILMLAAFVFMFVIGAGAASSPELLEQLREFLQQAQQGAQSGGGIVVD